MPAARYTNVFDQNSCAEVFAKSYDLNSAFNCSRSNISSADQCRHFFALLSCSNSHVCHAGCKFITAHSGLASKQISC